MKRIKPADQQSEFLPIRHNFSKAYNLQIRSRATIYKEIPMKNHSFLYCLLFGLILFTLFNCSQPVDLLNPDITASAGPLITGSATSPDGFAGGFEFTTGQFWMIFDEGWEIISDNYTHIDFGIDDGIVVYSSPYLVDSTNFLLSPIQNLGNIDFDALLEAPIDGYTTTNTGLPAIVSNTYCVITKSNHYAKVQITHLTLSNISIRWVYRNDGNRQFYE